jgi:tRNA pseudouridine(55) synthase
LVATWWYTKLIPYFEKDSKEYEFDIMLDGTTQSFDLWEEVHFLEEEQQKKFKEKLTKDFIFQVVQDNFLGTIEQTPPKYSALKIDGQRAYELARKWKDFDMKKRQVQIFDIEVLWFEYPKVSLRAKVSAWTYIRSIAADLWEILGTWWYISRLRRAKVWDLDISLACELDTIWETDVLDVKAIFKNKKSISLPLEIQEKINHWLRVHYDYNGEHKKWEDLFVENSKGEITNIVSYDGQYMIPIKKI